MPSIVKTTLRVTATAADIAAGVLSTAAAGLRGLAADERAPEPTPEPQERPAPKRDDAKPSDATTPGAVQDTAAAPTGHGEAPPAATRTRTAISNPKAARKVRQREQANS